MRLFLGRPAAWRVLGLIVAYALVLALVVALTQTVFGGSGLRHLFALVITTAGVLAVPLATGVLNIGRARWAALMVTADEAIDRGDVATAGAKLEAALADGGPFVRPVLAAESAERLANLMVRAGRDAEAERWLAETLRHRERVPGPNDVRTRATRDRLADLRAGLGDAAGAEELLRLQVESAGRAEGRDSAAGAAAAARLAQFLAGRGREPEGETLHREALDRLERAHGPHHWLLCEPLIGLAGAARRAGRPDEAEQDLRRAIDNASAAGRTEAATLAREALLDLYLASGRSADALPLSEALLQSQDAWADSGQTHLIELLARHAALLAQAGRAEEAARYRRRAEMLREASERATN
jgi:tetratricopeptide (TPR) repeat protein